ncbi:hypothetical protein EI77_00013 [Prosthecobacter fusiformis]|uniref:Uncharacterized protein n=1 Tax=Prosthecobacter fusiformis TaxID=48464 RepID=A0A4R7SQM0_9BACT|nr:hypothetical protein EI77_00013 [Prosthecobacter fusiformis]
MGKTNPHPKSLPANALSPKIPKWGKIKNHPHFPIQQRPVPSALSKKHTLTRRILPPIRPIDPISPTHPHYELSTEHCELSTSPLSAARPRVDARFSMP